MSQDNFMKKKILMEPQGWYVPNSDSDRLWHTLTLTMRQMEDDFLSHFLPQAFHVPHLPQRSRHAYLYATASGDQVV